MKMETRAYTVRFLTPAFLGNANQDGQWRTPPFKALLRQWWRVAWAEASGFSNDHRAMRDTEGLLFGTAAEGRTCRSRIRLRLSSWSLGKLDRPHWPELARVNHPEVNFPVDAGLYLGYGPVTLPRGERKPTLKANAAIQADESAKLALAFPNEEVATLDRALALLSRFGTVGGRSRNGWGSFQLQRLAAAVPLPLRDWRECMDRDWPHAIGRDDDGPLLWETASVEDWPSLMRRFAEIKIGLRTQFVFPKEKPPHQYPAERHYLAYPVTKHQVRAWGGNARLPNSLRFKAVVAAEGKVRGLIFHVPCLPTKKFEPDARAVEHVWRRTHKFLDEFQGLTRGSP